MYIGSTGRIERMREEDNRLLNLHLHEKSVPELTEHLRKTWQTVLQGENHHIIVKETDRNRLYEEGYKGRQKIEEFLFGER